MYNASNPMSLSSPGVVFEAFLHDHTKGVEPLTLWHAAILIGNYWLRIKDECR